MRVGETVKITFRDGHCETGELQAVNGEWGLTNPCNRYTVNCPLRGRQQRESKEEGQEKWVQIHALKRQVAELQKEKQRVNDLVVRVANIEYASNQDPSLHARVQNLEQQVAMHGKESLGENNGKIRELEAEQYKQTLRFNIYWDKLTAVDDLLGNVCTRLNKHQL